MGKDVLFTIFAFALFGLSKLIFNAVAIRTLDPSMVGDINSILAFHTILLVVASQPIASIVNRFVPEHLAVGDRESAGTLLRRGVLATLCASAVLTVIVLLASWLGAGLLSSSSLLRNRLLFGSLAYLWTYGMYFLFKMAYYGYQRIGDYCIAETISSACFFIALVPAALSGSPKAFILPWIVHPLVFCGCALRHFRVELGVQQRKKASETQYLSYAKYGLYWLTASASGLGAYHLSILFTRILQPSAAAVGYYSVALSLLTPLSLLPTSVAMVLFPRLTDNYTRGQNLVNADLIRKATVILVLPFAICAVAICGLSPEILRMVMIPATRENILAFQLVTWGLVVSLLSTPSGSFLSATVHAGTASAIGVSSLALGVVTWLWAIPRFGVVGTAVGYALLMVARGSANMVISNRVREWIPKPSGRAYCIVFLVVCSTCLPYPALSAAIRGTLIGSMMIAIMLLLLHEMTIVTRSLLFFLSRRDHRS